MSIIYFKSDLFSDEILKQRANASSSSIVLMVQLVVFISSGSEYEDFEITPYSTPPELPDVMRSSDGAAAAGGKE